MKATAFYPRVLLDSPAKPGCSPGRSSSWNIGGSGQLRGSAPRCTKAYLSRILKSLRILQQVKNRLSEKCDRSTGTDVSNE
ncbi:hypothetical protein RUM44_004188 [Polyplax serrata]|uniref:Uncharacterized protein n=1 Tax=Polyplax serrata TaxID=468196 RepID=A0ABR1B243_POLSC